MCCRQKEKRLQDEKLRSTKGLGEVDAEGDDLMAWVSKSRRKEDERAKAEHMAKLLQEQVHPHRKHLALDCRDRHKRR